MTRQSDNGIFVSENAAPGLSAALAKVDAPIRHLSTPGTAPDIDRPGAVPAAADLLRRDQQVRDEMAEAVAQLRGDVADIGSTVLGYMERILETDEAIARELRGDAQASP